MNWLDGIKEKVQEHLIKSVLALIGLLVGVIWAAIPSERWQQVSAATPKRVLWSALGLLALGCLLETAYIAHLRRKSKLKPRFGVLWNRSLTPYCPVHKEIALANWGNLATHGAHGYICPQGPHVIPLQDDEGNYLKPSDARKLLLEKDAVNDTYEPDAIGLKVLSFLAHTRSEVEDHHLTRHLKLHPERVSLYLSELENKGYLYSQFVGVAGAPITYHLTNKGRTFLANKNLI
jgi:DNA-binding transcriptional ArsR family regulator